jgi:hypothetical protein
VRLADDVLLFTTRVVYPSTPQGPGRELTLEQFVRAGRLQQVHAVLREAGKVLEHDGLWTANTWRMQSRLDGQVIHAQAPFREQPVCVDASSVTALLILGQTPIDQPIPVVELHPGFDAEHVRWSLAMDAEGNHRVRTQIGFKAFRLDGTGALEFALSKIGTGVIETRKLSASAFGGAGLPARESHPARAPDGAGTDPAAPRAGG